ncbi:MAG: hypothetical protein LC114_25840 [Bryobacterales bacterium]|nr:hypothetical protein [Bryobacterales bacterium]
MRRYTILIWLLVVFASGAAVGAAAFRYFAAADTMPEARENRKTPSREQLRQEYLGRLRERVGVSEEQLSQIVNILDQVRKTSDEKRAVFDADMKRLQDDARQKINALMTPEQLARYEAWRQERRAEREKREKERGGRGRPDSRNPR